MNWKMDKANRKLIGEINGNKIEINIDELNDIIFLGEINLNPSTINRTTTDTILGLANNETKRIMGSKLSSAAAVQRDKLIKIIMEKLGDKIQNYTLVGREKVIGEVDYGTETKTADFSDVMVHNIDLDEQSFIEDQHIEESEIHKEDSYDLDLSGLNYKFTANDSTYINPGIEIPLEQVEYYTIDPSQINQSTTQPVNEEIKPVEEEINPISENIEPVQETKNLSTLEKLQAISSEGRIFTDESRIEDSTLNYSNAVSLGKINNKTLNINPSSTPKVDISKNKLLEVSKKNLVTFKKIISATLNKLKNKFTVKKELNVSRPQQCNIENNTICKTNRSLAQRISSGAQKLLVGGIDWAIEKNAQTKEQLEKMKAALLEEKANGYESFDEELVSMTR